MKHGLIIFFLTSLLVSCGPQPVIQTQGNLQVSLMTEPAPPLSGRTATISLEVLQAGAPLPNATVDLRRSMPGMEHPDDRTLVRAEPDSAGRYRAQLSFAMGGLWHIEAIVTAADGSVQMLVFPITVEQP